MRTTPPAKLNFFNLTAFLDDYNVVAIELGIHLQPYTQIAQQNDLHITRTLRADEVLRDEETPYGKIQRIAKLLTAHTTIKLCALSANTNLFHSQPTSSQHPLDYQLPLLTPLATILAKLYPPTPAQLKTALVNLANLAPSLDRRRDQQFIHYSFGDEDDYAFESEEEATIYEQIRDFYDKLISREIVFNYGHLFAGFKLFQENLAKVTPLSKAERQAYDHYLSFITAAQREAHALELSEDELEILSDNPDQINLMIVLSKPSLKPLLTQFYPEAMAVADIESQTDILLKAEKGLAAQDAAANRILRQSLALLNQTPALGLKTEGLRRSVEIVRVLKSPAKSSDKMSAISAYLNSDSKINQSAPPLNLAGLSFKTLPRYSAGPPTHFPYEKTNFRGSILSHRALIVLILNGGDPREIDWESSALNQHQREYLYLYQLVCKTRQLCLDIRQTTTPEGIQRLYKQIIKPEDSLDKILKSIQKHFQEKQSINSLVWFVRLFIFGRQAKTDLFYTTSVKDLSTLLKQDAESMEGPSGSAHHRR